MIYYRFKWSTTITTKQFEPLMLILFRAFFQLNLKFLLIESLKVWTGFRE